MNNSDDSVNGHDEAANPNLPATTGQSKLGQDDLTQVSGSYYQIKAKVEAEQPPEEPIASEAIEKVPTAGRIDQTLSVAEMARLERRYSKFDFFLLFCGLGLPALTVIGVCVYMLTH